jgi:hypothetical protein
MPYCAHCGKEIKEGFLCVECQQMVIQKDHLKKDPKESDRYQPDPVIFSSIRPYGKPGKGIAAMILSIFSFFILWPLSVVGIILGIVSLKNEGKNGFAIAGIIVGIISFIVNLIFVIFLLPDLLNNFPIY